MHRYNIITTTETTTEQYNEETNINETITLPIGTVISSIIWDGKEQIILSENTKSCICQ